MPRRDHFAFSNVISLTPIPRTPARRERGSARRDALGGRLALHWETHQGGHLRSTSIAPELRSWRDELQALHDLQDALRRSEHERHGPNTQCSGSCRDDHPRAHDGVARGRRPQTASEVASLGEYPPDTAGVLAPTGVVSCVFASVGERSPVSSRSRCKIRVSRAPRGPWSWNERRMDCEMNTLVHSLRNIDVQRSTSRIETAREERPENS